jgi:hypothetical protein
MDQLLKVYDQAHPRAKDAPMKKRPTHGASST